MKQIILFVLMLTTAVLGVIKARSDKPEITYTEIYVVDSELTRLIPITERLIKGDAEFMAQQTLRRLIEGYDNNKKIRRIIPDKPGCVSLALDGHVACVNIKTKYVTDKLTSRDIEKLFVYQIVNTVTAIDGIDAVKFTLDGSSAKKLAGFLDMRNLYFPDYLVWEYHQIPSCDANSVWASSSCGTSRYGAA